MTHFPGTPFEPVPLDSLNTQALISLQRHIEERMAAIKSMQAEMHADWVNFQRATPATERAAMREELANYSQQWAEIRSIRFHRQQDLNKEAMDRKEIKKLYLNAQKAKWEYSDLLLAHIMSVCHETGNPHIVSEARRRCLSNGRMEPGGAKEIFDAAQATHRDQILLKGEPFSPWNQPPCGQEIRTLTNKPKN